MVNFLLNPKLDSKTGIIIFASFRATEISKWVIRNFALFSKIISCESNGWASFLNK